MRTSETKGETIIMKKLLSFLMALCLLCTGIAALAEEKAPVWEKMPLVVTTEEGAELTDADFEGDWIVDKVFYDTVYMTPEEVKAKGLAILPIRIAGGKVSHTFTDELGEHEVSAEYTLENNQLLTLHMSCPGWYNSSYMKVFDQIRDTLKPIGQ